jgi:SAM-dependent methyltransferase
MLRTAGRGSITGQDEVDWDARFTLHCGGAQRHVSHGTRRGEASATGGGRASGDSGAPDILPGANPNNPYHRAAGFYERGLSLPVISAIRRQEARAVGNLISRYADPSYRALEVGPGTGFYTLGLAREFGEVVAVEDSAPMAEILQGKLRAAKADNVTVITRDFLTMDADASFDVAVAIGVLDYVSDPVTFVAKMCSLARRAVIFTAPRRGLWGWCFVTGNRLRGTAVYCYDHEALRQWAPGWRCIAEEVGMKTPVTRGLTLVAALERRESASPAAPRRQ